MLPSTRAHGATRPYGIRLPVILTLATAAASCAHRPPPPAASPPAPDAFTAALRDAAEATPAERSNRLWAITPTNPHLRWDSGPSGPRVLMVTWTSYAGYNEHSHGPMALTREVWVTPAPQLNELCAATDARGDALATRLRQYLGLRPESRYDRVVELWVSPSDMFRPCPDPEIDDTVCELDFPASASAAHRAWFDALRTRSYEPTGYPWTRLGYTYDWGNRGSVEGASEFVVRSGATVGVGEVLPTDAYCVRRAGAGSGG